MIGIKSKNNHAYPLKLEVDELPRNEIDPLPGPGAEEASKG